MGHTKFKAKFFKQLGQASVRSSNANRQGVDFKSYIFTEVIYYPRHTFFITYLLCSFKVQGAKFEEFILVIWYSVQERTGRDGRRERGLGVCPRDFSLTGIGKCANTEIVTFRSLVRCPDLPQETPFRCLRLQAHPT